MTALAELRLPPNPDAPGVVRAWVADRFAAELSDSAATSLRLVLSELVTNAVVHGEGEITVKVHVREDAVDVEVVDRGTRSVPAIRAGGQGGGWGLQIVEAVSRRWGVHEGSTHVWAELAR